MTPDSELLGRYARTRSEEAFAELVRRHVNLVYSAALRQANGDAHLAQDVAQKVFTDLARKASSLSRHATLTGWLYTSAHFAAAKTARTEDRRRYREEQFMREPTNESAPAADWEKLRPALDDAMHELQEKDREAILLRYFENKPYTEVGTRLGLNENAARMRVDRALEKLRKAFSRRAVTTTAALASILSAQAIQTAPPALAAAITTHSLAAATTGTFTLLKIMTATQLKVGVTAIVAAGATTALVARHQIQQKLRTEGETLHHQLAQLETDNENLSNRLASASQAMTLPDAQMIELLKLRGEVGRLHQQIGEMERRYAANNQARHDTPDTTQPLPPDSSPERAQFEAKRTRSVNDAKLIGLAMRLWAGDNQDRYPTNFDQMTNELGGATNTVHFMQNFELVNAGTANDQYPQMLTIREITPRQAPDGKWERAYGLADGSVQTITSDDGNFYLWEKSQEQYNPPPNR